MRIAILTSGGDSPGMNAAVRTVAAVGKGRGHTVLGIRRGYDGLLEGDGAELDLGAIEGITRLGGTVLGSARCAELPTPAGQAKARAKIQALGIEALVVVGGNGSLTGAHLLGVDRPCAILGIPASIDNDIGHCGMAIGVDTACNTIVAACDKISDTARAHRRAFLVEVMGRRCGFLAMRAGIAAEADAILYGERELSEDDLVARLREVLRKTFAPGGYKKRCLIVKSEGVAVPISRLVRRLQEHLIEDAPGVDLRETVLGHVVRGGDPSALDRTIAQRLAFASVIAAERGAHDVMLSWDVPGGFGAPTGDPYVRVVPLAAMIEETKSLLDGTSPVIKNRVALLDQVEHLLAL
jgi:6-phosphofructokinase 1